MSIIIFLIVLAALVFVHELGHFLAAKKSGIRVDEFGLGFPPRIIGKKIGETVYSLNWIPFGGFVKIFGENPDEAAISGSDSSRSLVNKPKYIQVMVLIAGIFFNFLFAWALISVSFMSGVAASSEDYAQYASRIQNERVMITSVSAKSPAAEVGIKPGDVIKEIDFKTTILKAPAVSIEDIQKVIADSKGEDMTIVLARGAEEKVVHVVSKQGIVPDRYAVGIAMDKAGTLALPIHLAIWEGGKFTLHLIGQVASGLWTFISQAFMGTADYSSVSGPVGIVGMVGDATTLGFTYLLMFTALISINLGVINLIPFPALDGGRIFFVIIEAIIRRPIQPKIANMVNSVGFVLLLLLMLVVTYKDIAKLLVK